MASPAHASPVARADSPTSPLPLPAPLILLPRSLSPSQQSALPKPILGANKPSDLATSHISSLQHTLRPGLGFRAGSHSQQTTIHAHRGREGDGDPAHLLHLSSYQQVLARLGAQYSLDATSTVKPASPSGPHLARLRVDEMECQVCFRCGGHRDHDDIELVEQGEWGLQWVCKERCPDEMDGTEQAQDRKGGRRVEVGEEVEVEVEVGAGSESGQDSPSGSQWVPEPGSPRTARPAKSESGSYTP